MKNKAKLKKQLKHQRQRAEFVEKSNNLLERHSENQSPDKILNELPYMPFGNFSNEIPNTKDVIITDPNHPLNKHPDDFMQEIRERLATRTHENYDNKDNRLLLTHQEYVPASDRQCYLNGLVTNVKHLVKNNCIYTYVLLEEVYGKVKDVRNVNNYRWKLLTDHLWLDVNEYQVDDEADSVSVALGDNLLFSANINKYRGYRENINQNKYGVTDVNLIRSGYPDIGITDFERGTAVYKCGMPIRYPHRDNVIFKMYNKNKYPFASPMFGKQIDDSIRDKIDNPYYRIGMLRNLDIYGQLKYGFYQIKDDAVLGYDTGKPNPNIKNYSRLHWTHNLNYNPDTFTPLIKTSDIVPTDDFNDMYDDVAHQTKCRRTRFGISKDNQPKTRTHHKSNHNSKSLDYKIYKALH